MEVKLCIDDEKIDLNAFVEKMLGGMVVGAVSSLKGYEGGWKTITLEVKK
jgi:hypothetical protein